MKKQDQSNHTKYYPTHHFIFYPIVLSLIGFSLFHYKMEGKFEYVFLAVVFMLFAWLSFMMRQHYALGNQNRIIRLEMRLRYFQLSNERFEPIEKKLSFGQIAALRFASDDELLSLIDKTVKEDLNPRDIKNLIKNWQADYMRV